MLSHPTRYLPGIILCLLMGAAAMWLSAVVPIGAVAIAIILGIVLGNLLRPGRTFSAGIGFSEKHVLAVAIALMGVNLDFNILRQLGARSVLLVMAGVAFTLGSALAVGRLLHFDRKFALLLGIGNGICGSSAIAATEQIIEANEEEVGLSVAIVNALGTVGIFLLPFLGSVVLKFSDLDTGLMIGNTLQAVGQVVAAGFSVSEAAGQTATIIKMTRILMLFPVVLGLLVVRAGKTGVTEGGTHRPRVPAFIIGFILLSLVPTFNLLPEGVLAILKKTSHIALIVAMAGIGLKITFGSILRDGKAALVTGSLIFLLQILFSGCCVFLYF